MRKYDILTIININNHSTYLYRLFVTFVLEKQFALEDVEVCRCQNGKGGRELPF